MLCSLPAQTALKVPANSFLIVFVAFFFTYISNRFGSVSFSGWGLVVGQTAITSMTLYGPITETVRDPIAITVAILAAVGAGAGYAPRIKQRIGRFRFLLQGIIGLAGFVVLGLQYLGSAGSFPMGVSFGPAFWLSGIAYALAAIFAGTIFLYRADYADGLQPDEPSAAVPILGTIGKKLEAAAGAFQVEEAPEIKDIFVWDGTQWAGPFAFNSVASWHQGGKISAETFVCRLGQEAIPIRDLLNAPTLDRLDLPASGDKT